ncbi:metalloregulator ArsR/SmtB family transcription factor [bacterium]|nr:metalloregulator ArsR/SmtB family transcription factor [bacterium]
MGASKTELFTEQQNDLAQLAKALAHPARIAILQHLMSTGSCVTHLLIDELGLAQPTVSQHLRELKEAGLVKGTVEGPKVNYCIHTQGWARAVELLGDLLAGWNPDAAAQTACC